MIVLTARSYRQVHILWKPVQARRPPKGLPCWGGLQHFGLVTQMRSLRFADRLGVHCTPRQRVIYVNVFRILMYSLLVQEAAAAASHSSRWNPAQRISSWWDERVRGQVRVCPAAFLLSCCSSAAAEGLCRPMLASPSSCCLR